MNAFQIWIRRIHAILNPSNMILSYPEWKSEDCKVNLHYWRSDIFNEAKNNLGDELSPIVTNYLLSQCGLSLDYPIKERKHLYAIGSIIMMGCQNAIIWGSGILKKESFQRSFIHHSCFRHLDIRAVRGPLTRDYLSKMGHSCPPVYGDPAILMPLIYNPSIKKSKEFIIIPHYCKENYYLKRYGNRNILSMKTNDYKSVVDAICSSNIVISSSLHGIILAETYGVPAIFLNDRDEQYKFKYLDYYYSTNRREVISVSSVDKALATDPMDLPKNLSTLRDGLLESFPYDLWKNNHN